MWASGSGEVAIPHAGDAERRAGRTSPALQPAAPGTFQPGNLSLSNENPGREQLWLALDRTVRQWVEERAGTIHAWWATRDRDSRTKAVAFGDRGLCLAEPTVRTDHSPTYAINTYVIDPSTVRRRNIDHRPLPESPDSRARGNSPFSGRTAPPVPPPGDLPLTPAAKGALGNLPPLVQQLLQEPFARGEDVLRSEWHYEGWEDRLSTFTFVLAGPRTVTVATGSMVCPVGHSASTAHWNLSCYRAGVVRRIGQ